MRFARLPSELLESKLGLHSIAVFGALAFHDKKNDGVVFPRLTTIGELADLSINSVRKALQILAAAGWIEIREQGRKGSVAWSEYRLNYNHTVSRADTVTVSKPDTATVSSSDTVESPTVSSTVSKSGLSPYHPVTPNKKNRRRQEEDDLDDPSLASRFLSEACGNFNMHFQAERALQLKAEAAKRGISTKATADLMLSQWELYNSSRTKLSYPVTSAEKFWSSGTWHDSALWPWKEGTAPAGSNGAKPARYNDPNKLLAELGVPVDERGVPLKRKAI